MRFRHVMKAGYYPMSYMRADKPPEGLQAKAAHEAPFKQMERELMLFQASDWAS